VCNLCACSFRVCSGVNVFCCWPALVFIFEKNGLALARVHPRTHQVASNLAEGTIDGGGKVKGRRTRKAADKKDQQEDSDDAAGLLRFCFHLLVSATTPQLISGIMAYKCVAILHKTFLYAKFSTSIQPTCIHRFHLCSSLLIRVYCLLQEQHSRPQKLNR
jgi:hypothetical protein